MQSAITDLRRIDVAAERDRLEDRLEERERGFRRARGRFGRKCEQTALRALRQGYRRADESTVDTSRCPFGGFLDPTLRRGAACLHRRVPDDFRLPFPAYPRRVAAPCRLGMISSHEQSPTTSASSSRDRSLVGDNPCVLPPRSCVRSAGS